MFEYYFIEKYTICQGPDRKSRLILTVTELRRKFRRSKKPSSVIFDRVAAVQRAAYQNIYVRQGLGREPQQARTGILTMEQSYRFGVGIQVACFLARFRSHRTDRAPTVRRTMPLSRYFCSRFKEKAPDRPLMHTGERNWPTWLELQ